jgi:hypothetical protein
VLPFDGVDAQSARVCRGCRLSTAPTSLFREVALAGGAGKVTRTTKIDSTEATFVAVRSTSRVRLERSTSASSGLDYKIGNAKEVEAKQFPTDNGYN